MVQNPAVVKVFADLKKLADIGWKDLWDSGMTVVTVGTATCGRAAGALEVLDALKDEVKTNHLDVLVISVGCIGHCYAEPLVTVYKPGQPAVCYGHVNEVIARRLVTDYIINGEPCLEFVLGAYGESDMFPSFNDFPRAQYETKVLLQNCGRIDPEQIDHYIALGGYGALEKALRMSPEEIIAEVVRSALRGMGGAGYPAGQKWEICRQAPGGQKYVICNADEGDPGAFMDRAILESDPHSVIEGMIIAGFVIGARQGYIYVRAEYLLAVDRVKLALTQAKKSGLLGKKILGSEFSFDIKLFQGSGAFVCGEETALIASLEGKPGLPVHRPPYPAVSGLLGKPTLINNVKTLAAVRHIIISGGGQRTAVFALAGKVVNTGLTEVPLGTTLRDIVFNVGSGIPGGRRFKAVQIGGPSGGCLPEAALDLPADFDSLREAGAMMGSGGLIVMDEDDCMVEMARYFLEFTQRESCGKCAFCRLGTRQMLEKLTGFTKGQGKIEDLETLEQLAKDVKAGSLCSLGKTAPNPVLTTLRYFRDEYEAHIKEKRCPALMCRDLIAYCILPDKCERSCDACIGACAVEAITPNEKRIKVIDQEKCVKCGSCLTACPQQYSAIVKLSPQDKVPASGK